jgi:hypothetical protein
VAKKKEGLVTLGSAAHEQPSAERGREDRLCHDG